MKLQTNPITQQLFLHKSLKRIMSALLSMSLLLCAGCTDDFEPVIPTSGDQIEFTVSTSNGWTSPTRSRAAEPTQSLPRDTCYTMQSNGGKTMYLHTRTEHNTENPFVGDVTPTSRGTMMNNMDGYDSFGLFAGIFDGDSWDEENCSVNYIRNEKCSRTSGSFFSTDQPFFWPGQNQNIHFFAYAPYDNPMMSVATSESGSPTLTYTVPANVSEQQDIFTYDSGKSLDNEKQKINFDHALTAIQFYGAPVSDRKGKGKVKSITIQNVYSKASMKLGSNEWYDYSTPSDFKIEFETPIEIGKSEAVELAVGEDTFLMLPQSLTPNSKILVEFQDDYTGMEIVLESSIADANEKWMPCTLIKYYISSSSIMVEGKLDVSSEGIMFPFSALPQTQELKFASYSVITTANGNTSYVLEPYTAQLIGEDEYGNEVTQNLIGEDAEGPKLPYCIINPIMTHIPIESTLTQSIPEKTEVLSVGVLTKYGLKVELNAYDDDLRQQSSIGSMANPINLADMDKDGLETTANCYMVNSPGYYMLPLIYGNALVNGVANTNAYTKKGTKSSYTNYVNCKGDVISQPYIFIDAEISDANIIWQDVNGLINSVKLSSDRNYLIFHISESNIHEGNAVIGIYEGNKIVWSWHIWVTTYTQDKDVNFAYEGINFSFMGNYLGYCHEARRYYPERIVKIRLKQKRTGAIKDINITLDGQIITDVGNSVYYQWGRKDPFPGQLMDWTEINNRLILRSIYKPIYDKAGVLVEQPLLTTKKITIAESISNPDLQAVTYGNNSEVWHKGSSIYQNLWNNISNNNGSTTSTIKTVYDPSPVGYCVAPAFAADLFPNLSLLDKSGFKYSITNGNKIVNLSWTLRKNSKGFYDSESDEDYPSNEFAIWISNFHSKSVLIPSAIGGNCNSALTKYGNVALPLLPMRQN